MHARIIAASQHTPLAIISNIMPMAHPGGGNVEKYCCDRCMASCMVKLSGETVPRISSMWAAARIFAPMVAPIDKTMQTSAIVARGLETLPGRSGCLSAGDGGRCSVQVASPAGSGQPAVWEPVSACSRPSGFAIGTAASGVSVDSVGALTVFRQYGQATILPDHSSSISMGCLQLGHEKRIAMPGE